MNNDENRRYAAGEFDPIIEAAREAGKRIPAGAALTAPWQPGDSEFAPPWFVRLTHEVGPATTSDLKALADWLESIRRRMPVTVAQSAARDLVIALHNPKLEGTR